ncbi:hypothetical protein WUBG_17688, partial [Wuchereria bancrofti]
GNRYTLHIVRLLPSSNTENTYIHIYISSSSSSYIYTYIHIHARTYTDTGARIHTTRAHAYMHAYIIVSS